MRGPLEEAVAAAVEGGADWVQVRERDLGGRALLDLTDRVLQAARGAAERRGREVRVLVNRRIDVSLAAGADGAHLGFDALPPERARPLLPAGALLGVSTHAAAEVRRAAAAGVDYAQLAPIHAPLSKPATRPALGLGALAAAREAGIDVLAQGGIDASNAGRALAAGAAGVAVTGAVLGAPDPGAAAAALRAALDRARPTANP